MRDEAGRRAEGGTAVEAVEMEPSPDLRSSTGPVRPLTTTSSTAFVWWIVHARSEHSLPAHLGPLAFVRCGTPS